MRNVIFLLAGLVLAGLAGAAPAPASELLSPVFGDHMVLQRERPVPVWGCAAPGAKITVSFAGQSVETTADKAGRWRATLAPMPASKEGRTLTVTSTSTFNLQPSTSNLKLSDILVGEVWLASGQSNMELPIWGPNPHRRDREGALSAQLWRSPLVRFARTADYRFSETPKTEPSEPVVWKTLTRENLLGDETELGFNTFSAIGAYYAQELHQALDVPVGIIGAYWGGTRIEPWIPAEAFAGLPSGAEILARRPADQKQRASVLWNEQVAPWAPMALRGAIWYQGCQNIDEPDRYCELMHALYDGWSKAFANPDFKLYFAQLAPYDYGRDFAKNLPRLQEQQAKFAAEEPHAGMAVTTDVGNLDDCHPNEKRLVATRLALLALKRDYGFTDIAADSPAFRSARVEGSRFVLSFDHVREWFQYRPDFSVESGFEVAGADGVWHPAKVENLVCGEEKRYCSTGRMKGVELVVSSEEVPRPQALRYLHASPWKGTFFNEAGLPLGPFHVGSDETVFGAAEKVRTFGDGVHYLTETQVFTAADSGTVWKAAPGAKPVLSGARKVTGWRKAANGLWCADVPWVTGRENGFRQLTVNGELRPRAKHPNTDYFQSLDYPRPKDVTWHAWEYSYEKDRFRINPGEVDPQWDVSKGEVVFYHVWNDSHCPAASLAVENGTNWINLATTVRRNPCGCPWRLENLKEIADEPGEWALDYAESRVYYRPRPGEDLTKAEVAVPSVDTLVKIDGAKGLRFEGLTFADSRYELARGDRNDFQASSHVAAAVVLTNAADCVFDRCAFTRLSGYALDFQAGTCDSKVTRCTLTALGAGGIRLNHAVPAMKNTTTNLGYAAYEMPDPRVRVRGNEISDCEIGDYGRDFPSAVGVLLMNAEDTKVCHNDIHDGYYTGVSVGWNWGYLPSVARDNIVEYNHIWNIGKGLISDMGGIYLLGIAPGTKVRNNLIHDVDARFYGGWGIYPDEGSSGLLIENNVVYGTKFAPFHQHFGRNNTVRNNIFAGGKVDQLAGSRWEPHTRLFFYNNIVFWREGKLHSGSWHDDKEYSYLRIPTSFRTEPEWKLKKTTECDYNLYFNPTKELKDVTWGTQNCTWDDWRTNYLQDAHSAWGDPLFVDEAKHDYRLKPDSPALKLGFRPIDLSTVGPRK